MPTYEYRCKGCGADLEVVQSFTDDPLTTCEACGGELRKVFGSVGISFKGSGFYKTDSRSGSGSKSTSSSASGSEGSSSSDAATSESAGSGNGSGSGDKASSGSSGDKAAASTPSSPA